MTPNRQTLLEIFSKMSLSKQSDEKMRSAIKSGKLSLPYYSARGQECIPAAVSACLRTDDYICTIYRGMHDALSKGVPLKLLWAEYAGKASGTCKGKGGPMHITHPESGVMVTTGIVGSSMPVANGLAWASQLSGDGRVTVAYFGDGASNIGAFHEALNLASLWKLPVIFVCQNNHYSEHTRFAAGTAVDRVSRRADSYSMPGVTVNGNDPVDVYAAAELAIARARAGDGPTLIEAMTFRLFGHVFGDDDSVMLPGEREEAMKSDPYPIFRSRLIAEGNAAEDELAEIEAAHALQVNDALRYALESEYPGVNELCHDVYATETLS
ncbi:thiamine pyrophosphate-dependent dehydrogenase E1 component subunit alpha [Kineobactrum salinum]|uniref:Thiamine pyrophosphate-dependent dehydrogenase E1 component subunit alpha n=1 Tax=Kineobactrum salinum TaxID=2708301 RepID=A0A6C0U658_9GAMM|nr:thiamine pyrophosphate-dependent dehydrogenase E1 component subunit alpha [Kineobactrum salinum]QIB66839.1 thiamine pyrophosphate-dependent dehydrogenase E1 component subunit alpha [Kineobactrum salinum]